MDQDKNTQDFIDAFNIFSSSLGENDIYKNILLEVLFEELCKKNIKEVKDGSK